MSIDQARSVIAACLHGPPSEIVARLERCFHSDAVMYAPGFHA
jgi:hypothetical protein